MSIVVCSETRCKVDAVKECGLSVKAVKTNSGIPEQPFGRTMIRNGALNRLKEIAQRPAVAFESGIIYFGNECADITIVILRTAIGDFEFWTNEYMFNKDLYYKFLEQTEYDTLGKMVTNGENGSEWYNRKDYLKEAFIKCYSSYYNTDIPVIKGMTCDFNKVNFVDIQNNLMSSEFGQITEIMIKLGKNLHFNKVMLVDSRGFLFAGCFKKYPLILARKAGKLPRDVITEEYNKEYGKVDSLSIQVSTIQKGDQVLVVDDVVGTGGTFRACEKLVNRLSGIVTGFIALYAIKKGEELLFNDPRLRYALNEKVPAISYPSNLWFPLNKSERYIVMPTLSHTITLKQRLVIEWKQYFNSPNIWFQGEEMEGKDLYIVINQCNNKEMNIILQLLSIIHRKEPKSVTIIAPFIEVGTQDKIERKDNKETLALMDTFAKVIGNYKVITFDVHNKDSRCSFHNLKNLSIIDHLFAKFVMENNTIPITLIFPDEGAHKRFGYLAEKYNIKSVITFEKTRKGDKRIVRPNTDIIVSTSSVNTKLVIVDDMVRSGGTMNAIANYLLDHYNLTCSVLFAHCALEPNSVKNMSIFTDIWSSDTCPEAPMSWIKCRYSDLLADFSSLHYN